MVFQKEINPPIDLFFIIESFIKKFFYNGLKAKTSINFKKAMLVLKLRSNNKSPFLLFCTLFQKYQIYAELRPITKSGRTYKVLAPVLGFKRILRLISLFLQEQRKVKKSMAFFQRCGESFFEWSRKQGPFIKLLKDLSLQLLESRPYMKYARRKFF